MLGLRKTWTLARKVIETPFGTLTLAVATASVVFVLAKGEPDNAAKRGNSKASSSAELTFFLNNCLSMLEKFTIENGLSNADAISGDYCAKLRTLKYAGNTGQLRDFDFFPLIEPRSSRE